MIADTNDLAPSSHAPHLGIVTTQRDAAPVAPVKLRTRGLDFYYDKFHALKNITMDIPEKRVTAMIGPSGCGKSTLLRIFNRIYALYPKMDARGEVLLDGENILDPKYPLNRLRSKVGMVFQNPDRQLFSASVREDVSFGPLNLGLDQASVAARVDAALEAVGMSAFAHKPVQNLSFGQKKRACIAGVLAMEPELLVLDDPMAGLDQAMQEELLAVLERLHGQGMTILLATHDIHFAYRWADRIHLMTAGRCTAAFDAGDLPRHEAELAAVGLRLPAVIGLQRALVERGILPADLPTHSCTALLALLEQHRN
jgi:cobalt/nickel transport system ATP-binding protein